MKFNSRYSWLSSVMLATITGISLFVTSCRPTNFSHASDIYSGSNITMSLRHDHTVGTEDKELLFSALHSAAEIGLCVIRSAADQCSKQTPGYQRSKIVYANSLRKFFLMQYPALIAQGLALRVVAFDRAGSVVDQRDIEFTWAGVGQPPAAGSRTGLPGATGSYAGAGSGAATNPQIQAIMQNNCAGTTCHNATYVANPASMKAVAQITIGRLQSGNMPQGKAMSPTDMQALITYLQQP